MRNIRISSLRGASRTHLSAECASCAAFHCEAAVSRTHIASIACGAYALVHCEVFPERKLNPSSDFAAICVTCAAMHCESFRERNLHRARDYPRAEHPHSFIAGRFPNAFICGMRNLRSFFIARRFPNAH